MPIDQLVQEELGYLPRFLSIVSSSDSLLALVKLALELVFEICTLNRNKYQQWHKENSQSTKGTLTIRQTIVEPRER